MFKYSYNHELGVATIASTFDGIKVHTLLQNPGTKRAAATAFMGARYSRSRDSIIDIMQEVSDKGIDPVKRLEAIFHGYGHASVGDLCTLTVAIENVPMFTAERFFALNPVHFAQARSTRYQDFSNPAWIEMGYVSDVPRELAERHASLMWQQFQAYRELGEMTAQAFQAHFNPTTTPLGVKELGALNARIFDTTRYLLPLGVNTSFAALMTARGWSEYIGLLKGSDQSVDRAIGELLFQLLVGVPEHLEMGYVPEADGLIRHSEPNTTQEKTTEALLKLCKNSTRIQFRGLSVCPDVAILPNLRAEESLYQHVKLLTSSTMNPKRFRAPGRKLEEKMGAVVFERHNNYRQLGLLAQSGAIGIHGRLDVGSLRDMNRHRSLERFIPFYQSAFNLFPELVTGHKYELCPYLELPVFLDLKEFYTAHFNKLYDRVYRFYMQTLLEVPTATALEFTRYLLPHAHRTTYRMYGSVDDLQYTIHLRHRPGGHIRYRLLVYRWLEKLAKQSPFWKPMLANLKEPDPSSLEEFFNRS